MNFTKKDKLDKTFLNASNLCLTRIRYWVAAFAVPLSAITYIYCVFISQAAMAMKKDPGFTTKQMG